MEEITILWLDDDREPVNFFNKNKKQRRNFDEFGKGKDISGAARRTLNFYERELEPNYNIHFEWVRNFNEFKQYILENGIPDFVSFDRDLKKAPMEGIPYDASMHDGIACARFLKEYCQKTGKKFPKCFAHTANVNHLPELEYVLGNSAYHEPVVGPRVKDYEASLAKFNKEHNIQENIKKHINMKNRIRLTESQLHRVIKESVKNVLNEWNDFPFNTSSESAEGSDALKTALYNEIYNTFGDITDEEYDAWTEIVDEYVLDSVYKIMDNAINKFKEEYQDSYDNY